MPAKKAATQTPESDLGEGQVLEQPAAEPEAREPIPGEGLGRIAYDAYCTAVGGVSVRGEQLPTWDEQVKDKPDTAAAWCASAQAVISATWEGKKA